jgi:hypothetical protein
MDGGGREKQTLWLTRRARAPRGTQGRFYPVAKNHRRALGRTSSVWRCSLGSMARLGAPGVGRVTKRRRNQGSTRPLREEMILC